jgi:hypothetical protein
VNSGEDAEAQPTGLHDHLTSILWIFGRGAPKDFGVFRADQ